jgi:hypothetical protein
VYAVPLGPRGKSKESIHDAFLELFELHAKRRDYPVRVILFDGEAGVKSLMVRKMLAERDIALHIYEYSKVKSAMAEGLNKQLRAAFTRIKESGASERQWHQIISFVVEAMNDQKLVINGKQMSFSANEITQKTLGRFLTELERLNPVYLFSHFSIDTSMFEYKFAVGSYVVLKQKAISTDTHEKRSQIAVDAEEWIVVKQVAYFSQRMKIVLCYVIQSLIDQQQIVAPEDSLVQIEPTTVERPVVAPMED